MQLKVGILLMEVLTIVGISDAAFLRCNFDSQRFLINVTISIYRSDLVLLQTAMRL